MNNELPIWDLSEIYKNINDPKISRDIKNIRGSANNFLKKWKGKINNLSPSDFLICINEYQEINEAIYKIATHSNLTFATNMEDPEISKYNSSISDQITEILSTLIFVTLELSKVDDNTVNNWLNDKEAKNWEPYLNILRKRNPYLLDPLVEEILIEKSATGRSAWIRLFDETSAALRFPFKNKSLTEAEILNLLSDADPENRKIAGKSLSEVLENNKDIVLLKNDAQLWKNEIIELMKNTQKRENLSINAYEKLKNNYKYEDLCERFFDILKN